MGPESHSAINSAMLPKEMAGSGQEWHKSDKESWWGGGGGEGLGLAGWQESCYSVWQVKTIYIFFFPWDMK